MYDTTLDTHAMPEQPAPWPGVSMRRLHPGGEGGDGCVALVRLAPGAMIPAHRHTHATQTAYVLEGDLIDAGTTYGPGTFLVAAPGQNHGPHGSAGGCVLLTTYRGAVDFVAAE